MLGNKEENRDYIDDVNPINSHRGRNQKLIINEKSELDCFQKIIH